MKTGTYTYLFFARYATGIILCGFAACSSQRIPDSYGLHKVRLNEPDRSVVLEVIPVSHNPGIETDRSYYWYSGGKIHSTQGGYSGKLLNGTYNEYHTSNKALKAQGQFSAGLKTGVWRSWNEDGNLHELITWKDGYRSGTFNEYTGHGRLLRSGRYQHDLLQGKLLTYGNNDSVITSRYKNGKLVQRRPPVQSDTSRKPIWRRYWPFKSTSAKIKKVKAPKPPKVKKKIKLNEPDITAAP